MSTRSLNRLNKLETSEKGNGPTTQDKFNAARVRMQQSVLKHLDKELELSSEEEDLESDAILESVTKNYSTLGGKNEDLGRTQNFLENAFQSGAAVCLICIATVKRTESIWSCESCYGFFHLFCVQRWAKDSIAHQKLADDDRQRIRSNNYFWQCPKCRKDYDSDNIPNLYECFCRQTLDPEFQPWLVPHSCGQVCNKPLEPKCGHSCLLLCHPGPCPPCPKMILANCFCLAKREKTVRCSQKLWSCGQTCQKKLLCGKHSCELACHKGDCPPCNKTSSVKCDCGRQSASIPCAQLTWKCDRVCGKPFSCGLHSCVEVCHPADECGICPKSLPRSCPCGKETVDILTSCAEEVNTCGGTCEKLLDCGMHVCSQRCHRGPCGPCMEFLFKYCRCGQHFKELPCAKEFLCETKCKGMRDCMVHPCSRKCCDGRCPPCEKPCRKTLNCGTHKCTSVCHRGPCYPCEVTKTISCRCGSTVVTVPCGTPKRKKNLRCSKLCEIVPDCHHEKREEHKCHLGPCPPCQLICGKKRFCGHRCTLPCHSAVIVTVQKTSQPWGKSTPTTEMKEMPCPDCTVPVPVWCPGGHEKLHFPCHRAVSQPCGRSCGRLLPCKNHTCSLPCHRVITAKGENLAGDECENCMEDCDADRACSHPCPNVCHPPPCPPCNITLKLRCHCGLNFTYSKCSTWLESDEDHRNAARSCGNQCPKNYDCGHRCTASCHPGDCPEEYMCKKKLKITCPCKRIKKLMNCHLINDNMIFCDDVCRSEKLERKKKEENEKQGARLAEERRNREEFEKYEKKLQGGGKKQRPPPRERAAGDDDSKGFWRRNKFLLASVGFATLATLLGAYLSFK